MQEEGEGIDMQEEGEEKGCGCLGCSRDGWGEVVCGVGQELLLILLLLLLLELLLLLLHVCGVVHHRRGRVCGEVEWRAHAGVLRGEGREGRGEEVELLLLRLLRRLLLLLWRGG